MAKSHYAHHHFTFPVGRQVPSVPPVSQSEGWFCYNHVSSIALSDMDPVGGVLCQHMGVPNPKSPTATSESGIYLGYVSFIRISLSSGRVYQQNDLG